MPRPAAARKWKDRSAADEVPRCSDARRRHGADRRADQRPAAAAPPVARAQSRPLARRMGAADPRDRDGRRHAPLDDAYMRQFPKLEIISSFGVGYDNIDAKAAARLGIIVTNTPGVLDDEVADTALGLMIMTVRQLPQAERYLRAGQLAEGRLPAQPFAEGPHRRHSRTRAHRQGDRDARQRLRARCRLSRPARRRPTSPIATILRSSTWPRPPTF